ncbi:proline dehydrogenase 1, mitochondrial-like isoform X2 [Pecten maximus]|uniref:proline dehydrogenase 1, mitochondrial-like isoform X2 n=1 Tax=Pecten maximus TaxID=6579 RepID=UPI001458CBD9|nr:proline dehydrogenase 1, mitochondrial-like isoform X2 [Pecten maximus]
MAVLRVLCKTNVLPFYRQACPISVLKTRYHTSKSTSASSASISSQTQSINEESRLDSDGHPVVDLSFSNGKEAYRSKTTAELIRALFVFNMCSIQTLVTHNNKLLKWSRRILGGTLFRKMMKATFYGHFVAGEDQVAIRPLVSRNKQFGVKSILDYSVEEDLSTEQAEEAEMKSCVSDHIPDDQTSLDPDKQKFLAHKKFGDRRNKVISARTYFYEDEANCDTNTETFLKCIDAVAGATEVNTGFVAIKMTALGRPQFLLQMSDVLVSTRAFFEKFAGNKGDILLRKFREEDFKKQLEAMGVQITRNDRKRWFSVLDISQDGEVDLLDWDNLLEVNMSLSKVFVVPNEETGKLEPLVTSLSTEEEKQMKNMLGRLNTIAKYATQKGVRVMVDAEQTYFQPAISRLCMEMMRRFNREQAVIFNTYQCYLKSAYNNACLDMDLARREDFHFGAKLVRGAYMEQERERAADIGYEDPINPTYEATSDMYHQTLEEVMRQINRRDRGKIAVMVASHNENTVRYTVEKMKEFKIRPADRLICFGQLLGMCDQVSFPLGQAGYSVYKYVPYGPVEEVLPYLSRRAMENRGILKKVKKEKNLLWCELKRRLSSGQIIYNPAKHVPSP